MPGPLSPSALDCDAMDTVGGSSSSVIVPVPVPFPDSIDAFVGALSTTRTVSSTSSESSPVTVTSIVLLVSPAANVSVPPANAV